MSMSWKSYLFAVFVIALVYQVNAETPEDVKITSISGSLNRTIINAINAEQIFVQFTVQSTGGKLYKIKDATLNKGKWFLGVISNEATEYAINSVTFQYTPVTFGALQRLGNDEGIMGSFYIKTEQGTPAMKVDFTRKEGEQVMVNPSEGTTCSASRPGPEFHIWTFTCD